MGRGLASKYHLQDPTALAKHALVDGTVSKSASRRCLGLQARVGEFIAGGVLSRIDVHELDAYERTTARRGDRANPNQACLGLILNIQMPVQSVREWTYETSRSALHRILIEHFHHARSSL